MVKRMLSDLSKVLEDSTRGGFYLTLGSVLSEVISAITVFIVARILGPELYGLYTITMIVPTFLFLFMMPGINQGIIRFSARLRAEGKTGRLRKLFIHALIFQMVLGLAASLISFAFSDLFATVMLNRPEATGYIQTISAMIILQVLYNVVISIFIGLDRTEYNTLATTTQAVTKAIVSPALVILGLSITGALTGNILSFLIAGLLGTYLFAFKICTPLKSLKEEEGGSFKEDLKMLISYGFPLSIATWISGFTLIYQNILLALFTSNLEVGNFKAAMNFTTIVTCLSLPIANTVLPAFSKLEKRDEDVKDFFKASVKYVSMMILPVSILLILYSKEIIQIMYGEDYQLAPMFLSLNILHYLLVGLGYLILGGFFNGLGETRINLKTALLNGAVMISLAPILTWYLGVNGIIIATAFAAIVGTIYGLHVAKNKFKVKLGTRTMMRIYIVSFVSAIPLLMIQRTPYSSLIKVTAGAIIYLAIYLLLIPTAKVITPKELRQIKTIIEKVKPLKYLSLPFLYYEEKIMKFS